jgi:hypothetical protein
MKKVEEYRARADECRSMATRSRLPQDKTMLMNMAATWESFAVTETILTGRRGWPRLGSQFDSR